MVSQAVLLLAGFMLTLLICARPLGRVFAVLIRDH